MSIHAASSLDYADRRAVIAHMLPRSQQASPAQKTLPLDGVMEVTGYAGKYAIGLLKQASEGRQTIQGCAFSCFCLHCSKRISRQEPLPLSRHAQARGSL